MMMAAVRHDPPDLRRLLAPVGVERFFADYWQRRPLNLQLEPGDFVRILEEVGPLDVGRLAGLAQKGVQAWIANDYVAHSVVPVDATTAPKFFAIGATLYFLGLPLDRLRHAIADFLGAPRQMIVASLFLTPATGGASPHFDKNENFTIQLTGAKRWMVSETPAIAGAPEGYVFGQDVPPSLSGLLDPSSRPPELILSLRPGTLLYVPRGAIHRTEAGEASWSLNLSYSGAMWLDLLRVGLRRRLGTSARWRSTVTGVTKGCDPAMRATNILPELAAELREMLADPGELERLAQEYFQEPNIFEPGSP